MKCKLCKGTGKTEIYSGDIYDGKCTVCNGTGEVKDLCDCVICDTYRKKPSPDRMEEIVFLRLPKVIDISKKHVEVPKEVSLCIARNISKVIKAEGLRMSLECVGDNIEPYSITETRY